MNVLDKKLLRNLRSLKGQVITIALVVAAGISLFVAMRITYNTLEKSKDNYYTSNRFPDIFASAEKVPQNIAGRIESLEGISTIDTRIVEPATVPMTGLDYVPSAVMVSLPDFGEQRLDKVHLVSGRMPETDRADETLILKAFAEAHDLKAGDSLPVVANGQWQDLTITGIAMAPAYIFAISGSAMGYDPKRFAVFWMRESALAPRFAMTGAFNELLVATQPGASEAEIISQIDRILEPYGSMGAYGRDKQMSHHFVTGELEQLSVQATIIPLIFLGVAAFLVNVVLSRLIQLQRNQIATLKAVGYSNRAVGMHYLKLVSVIVVIGSVLGIGIGLWMGSGLLSLYRPFFHFPSFEQQFEPGVLTTGVVLSLASALIGALMSVRKVMKLPPADAMKPPSPPQYHESTVDRVGKKMFGPMGRMVLREVRRRYVRLAMSAFGIAMAVAILVVGRFMYDSMAYLKYVHFEQSMREDISIGFYEPVPENVLGSLGQLPGVLHAEGVRTAPVRITFGAAKRDTAINGYDPDSSLRRLLNANADRVVMRAGGLLLTDVLADRLGVSPGDTVEVQQLTGDRKHHKIYVAGLVSDLFGLQGYMDKAALQQVLGEPPLIDSAMLSVERQFLSEVERRLRLMPAVSGFARPETALANFDEQSGDMMLIITAVLVIFAAVIAVGIVYNNARVSLSMRSRDLASMRVLGFTRREISVVLLGEMTVQVLLAIPLGLFLGTEIAELILQAVDPENYRFPVVISAKTYIFAVGVAALSSAASALLVRRKLDKLDLIDVLKTRQ